MAAATRIQSCWRSFRDAVAYASYRSMMAALDEAQRECAAYDIQRSFADYRARVGEAASAEALLGAMGVMLAVEENVSALVIQARRSTAEQHLIADLQRERCIAHTATAWISHCR